MTAIYELKTGKIKRWIDCPYSVLLDQRAEGEEIFLNCAKGMTHIVNNEPAYIAPPPPADEVLLWQLRRERNARLMASDWTQAPDAPLTDARKADWRVYRQTLRDFPSACDPANPVWPEPPQV